MSGSFGGGCGGPGGGVQLDAGTLCGGGLLDGVQDALDFPPVLERRRRFGPAVDGEQEVADFVREGVLPADDVALRPPGVQVGVFGFAYEDPAEALLARGRRGVKEPEFVEVLKVESQG